MDQIKIGKFIAALRREQNMTQRELADRLNVSDKTVSKWETGHGLPEVALMLPLCEIFHITVNELLSGERLDDATYFKKAEENMANLIQEKEEAKKKIVLSVIVALIVVIAGVTIICMAGLLEMPTGLRILLILVALAIVVGGIAVACVLDREAGVFECPKCGERFVPDMKSYIMGAHTITKRYLKCPKCGKSSYCRHRLSQ